MLLSEELVPAGINLRAELATFLSQCQCPLALYSLLFFTDGKAISALRHRPYSRRLHLVVLVVVFISSSSSSFSSSPFGRSARARRRWRNSRTAFPEDHSPPRRQGQRDRRCRIRRWRRFRRQAWLPAVRHHPPRISEKLVYAPLTVGSEPIGRIFCHYVVKPCVKELEEFSFTLGLAAVLYVLCEAFHFVMTVWKGELITTRFSLSRTLGCSTSV